MESLITEGPRYNRVAIALHWIIAAMIIANYILVWTAEDAPKAEEQRLVGLHMATGMSILVLSVLRIVWRVICPAPPFEPGLKAWEVTLAKITHALFYFLIIAIPFTGWAMTSAASGGMGVNIYGIFEFPGLPFGQDRDAAGALHEVHEVMATAMLALFVLHVVAAFKHMFVDRDGTMARMVPWLK